MRGSIPPTITTLALRIYQANKSYGLTFAANFRCLQPAPRTKCCAGSPLLRVKVAEPHGFYRAEVRRLQQQGLIAKQAETTISKSRRRAEDFLSLLNNNSKPTLKGLRGNPAILYSPAMTQAWVTQTLDSWGCKFSVQLQQKAKTASARGTVAPHIPLYSEPLSVYKIRRIQGLCSNIQETAKEATPAEKDEIWRLASILMAVLTTYMKPPYWGQPPGPEHYEI